MPDPSEKPRLLDQVRGAIRARHYSHRTEDAYVFWIRKFILFHEKRHPAQMREPEIARYLSWLATDRKVSASTQNQALSALLFLYRNVLGITLESLPSVPRAVTPARVPVVLSQREVRLVMEQLRGVPRLVVNLLASVMTVSAELDCGKEQRGLLQY